MSWMLFWKVFIIATLALFGAMSVWVVIGGAVDLRRMLIRLRDGADDDEREE